MARRASRLDRASFVDRLADDVHDAPERASPTGTEIGAPVSVDFLAAHQAFGNVHGDAAHGVLAEMLRDLEHEPVAVVGRLQRVEDRRQFALELHVDDGADHLGDVAGGVQGGGHGWTSSFQFA